MKMSDKEPTAPVTLEFLIAHFANSAIYHNEDEANAARAEITRI
jgi:hypothetical protein